MIRKLSLLALFTLVLSAQPRQENRNVKPYMGNGPRIILYGSTSQPDAGDCIQTDGNGNLITTGSPCGSGSGGDGEPNYSQAFTSQTSVTLAHNMDTLNVVVQCFNGSNVAIEYNTLTLDDVNNATVTFSGSQTGRCVVNGNGGASPNSRYSASVSSSNPWTITQATHGLGSCDLLVSTFSVSGSNQSIIESNGFTCDNSTYTVTISWNVNQAGRVLLVRR